MVLTRPVGGSCDGSLAMDSAKRLFWFQLALGALGAAAAGLAVTAASQAVSPAVPSWSALQAICTTMLSGASPGGRLLILTLAGLGLAVPVRGATSVFRQVRATRGFLRSLTVARIEDGPAPVITVDDDRPLAFCAGLLRPRIYVSTGTRRLLAAPELAAVLAHERHHARRFDPLRMLIVDAVRNAVFFVPVLGRCRSRYGSLAELAADEQAIATAGVRPLASALATFDAHGGPLAAVSPERVDHLLGARHAWDLSPMALIGSLWSIAGVTALAVAASTLVGTNHVTLIGLASTACGVAIIALPVVAGRLVLGSLGERAPRR